MKKSLMINKNYFRNKKILVTGSAGFIGSNLVKRLQSKGAKVKAFDKSIGKDITNNIQVKNVLKENYEIIFHLAAFSGSLESNQNISLCFEVNTYGTLNLLEAIAKYSPKTKLIISSSRLEYGTPLYLPVDEHHRTFPTSIYGLSKLLASQLSLLYSMKNNLNITIFRTSNVYGLHPKKNFSGYNLINHYIDLAKLGKELIIFGDGSQQRDYIYINDLLDAFLLGACNCFKINIYNLGYGKPIKVRDMVNMIVREVGKGAIKYVEWPRGYTSIETGSYISDIKKAKQELDFVPKTDFQKGIQQAILQTK